jgi:hypothetical protein
VKNLSYRADPEPDEAEDASDQVEDCPDDDIAELLKQKPRF